MELLVQVEHHCSYWTLDVPLSKSTVERVGQLIFVRPNFFRENITSWNANPFNSSLLD